MHPFKIVDNEIVCDVDYKKILFEALLLSYNSVPFIIRKLINDEYEFEISFNYKRAGTFLHYFFARIYHLIYAGRVMNPINVDDNIEQIYRSRIELALNKLTSRTSIKAEEEEEEVESDHYAYVLLSLTHEEFTNKTFLHFNFLELMHKIDYVGRSHENVTK